MNEMCACVNESRIDRLELDVKELSSKVNSINDNSIALQSILKRLEEDSVSQKQTNSEMNKTMVSIQMAMTEITFAVKELNTELAAEKKISSEMAKKIEAVDEKGKVDIISTFIKLALPALIGWAIGKI